MLEFTDGRHLISLSGKTKFYVPGYIFIIKPGYFHATMNIKDIFNEDKFAIQFRIFSPDP